ncbi:hypothetical protein JTB14_005884 [Gonioctena quinquepunctata]|nr:hypothetical protein JTB14_005884 [Gonioctena quinquepunctata]
MHSVEGSKNQSDRSKDEQEILYKRRLIQNEGENWHEIIQIGKKKIEVKLDTGLVVRLHQVKYTNEDEDIFKGLRCLNTYENDIDLVENSKCRIQPSRRIPYYMKKQVREEFDEMVNLGVIKPIKEPTPVVSAMVVVELKDKLRICIDPADVNKHILRRHYLLKTIVSKTEWSRIIHIIGLYTRVLAIRRTKELKGQIEHSNSYRHENELQGEKVQGEEIQENQQQESNTSQEDNITEKAKGNKEGNRSIDDGVITVTRAGRQVKKPQRFNFN